MDETDQVGAREEADRYVEGLVAVLLDEKRPEEERRRAAVRFLPNVSLGSEYSFHLDSNRFRAARLETVCLHPSDTAAAMVFKQYLENLRFEDVVLGPSARPGASPATLARRPAARIMVELLRNYTEHPDGALVFLLQAEYSWRFALAAIVLEEIDMDTVSAETRENLARLCADAIESDPTGPITPFALQCLANLQTDTADRICQKLIADYGLFGVRTVDDFALDRLSPMSDWLPEQTVTSMLELFLEYSDADYLPRRIDLRESVSSHQLEEIMNRCIVSAPDHALCELLHRHCKGLYEPWDGLEEALHERSKGDGPEADYARALLFDLGSKYADPEVLSYIGRYGHPQENTYLYEMDSDPFLFLLSGSPRGVELVPHVVRLLSEGAWFERNAAFKAGSNMTSITEFTDAVDRAVSHLEDVSEPANRHLLAMAAAANCASLQPHLAHLLATNPTPRALSLIVQYLSSRVDDDVQAVPEELTGAIGSLLERFGFLISEWSKVEGVPLPKLSEMRVAQWKSMLYGSSIMLLHMTDDTEISTLLRGDRSGDELRQLIREIASPDMWPMFESSVTGTIEYSAYEAHALSLLPELEPTLRYLALEPTDTMGESDLATVLYSIPRDSLTTEHAKQVGRLLTFTADAPVFGGALRAAAPDVWSATLRGKIAPVVEQERRNPILKRCSSLHSLYLEDDGKAVLNLAWLLIWATEKQIEWVFEETHRALIAELADETDRLNELLSSQDLLDEIDFGADSELAVVTLWWALLSLGAPIGGYQRPLEVEFDITRHIGLLAQWQVDELRVAAFMAFVLEKTRNWVHLPLLELPLVARRIGMDRYDLAARALKYDSDEIIVALIEAIAECQDGDIVEQHIDRQYILTTLDAVILPPEPGAMDTETFVRLAGHMHIDSDVGDRFIVTVRSDPTVETLTKLFSTAETEGQGALNCHLLEV